MADPKQQIDLLKDLTHLCRDGQASFRDAAEKIADPVIRAFLHEQSLERGRFAGELENELHRLGEKDVDQSGSVGGAVHRGWTNLKSALGGGDAAILAELERGEDATKDAYDEAIYSKQITQQTMSVLMRQFESIKSSHDRVKQFRDTRKAA